MKKTENPEYTRNKSKWKYAWDHYTGVYGELESDGGSIRDYLQQKYQREDNKAYDERLKVTDLVMHFATVIDGINGVAASNEDQKQMSWGELGEDGEPVRGTIAYSIDNNADLNGTNWSPMMMQAGIHLTVLHDVWGLIEGVTDRDEAHIKIINPVDVVDWHPTSGSLEEVLVKESRPERMGIFKEGGSEDTYTLFTLEGWFRYRETDDGMVQIDSGEYEYYETPKRRKRILPIYRTSIPFPRHVGYQLALKENHIFNKKSVRDFALRNLSFSILNLSVQDEKEYRSILKNLKGGANVIPSYNKESHQFITPDGSYLSDFQSVLEDDVEQFYHNAFKKYAESASQVTATSARLESHSGIEAFLSLLVSSIDEFENQALKRLEQVYLDEPSRWGHAFVERSTDFRPKDVEGALQKISSAIMNADRANAMSTEQKVKLLHPEWTEEKIEEEVQAINAEQGASIPDPFEGD